MKTRTTLAVAVLAAALAATGCGVVRDRVLAQEFSLGESRTQVTRYYVVETIVVHHADDGARTGADTLKFWLKCEPTEDPDVARYTVRRFEFSSMDGPVATIPDLAGWTYEFGPAQETIDEDNQVFAIPHERFVGLEDSNGDPLAMLVMYGAYNHFVDFHALCNVFALPTTEGGGIQDLKRLGDRVVHAAAHSEPPVHLAGSALKEGSFFRNGEITLELKGIGVVGGEPCAVITYDSGVANFMMILEPMPGMEVVAKGSSHYRGDIYVGLDSGWVERADLLEPVIAKTTMGGEDLQHDVIERTLIMRVVDAATFEQDTPEAARVP